MILTIALIASATGATVGLFAALRARRARAPGETSELGRALAAARTPTRGLAPGDVLMIPGEELALGGMLVLHEGDEVLRAFSLVGAATDRWLVQLDDAGRDLVLARESDVVPEGPVAAVLPLDGRTLGLEKRGTARVEASGEGLPASASGRAPYVVLAERGGRAVIVIDLPGGRLTLRGERLDPRVVDRLGGSS